MLLLVCVSIDRFKIRGFRGIEKEIEIGTWFVKKVGTHNPLSPEALECNIKIEKVRHRIEHSFAKVKTTFLMFLGKFRHDHTWITPLWRFACALHNLRKDWEAAPDIFPTRWEKGIPYLQHPIQGRKVAIPQSLHTGRMID